MLPKVRWLVPSLSVGLDSATYETASGTVSIWEKEGGEKTSGACYVRRSISIWVVYWPADDLRNVGYLPRASEVTNVGCFNTTSGDRWRSSSTNSYSYVSFPSG